MISKLITRAALALTLAAGAAQADFEPLKQDPKEIDFGIISTESTQNLKAQWEPFLKDMEKALGMKVNAFFAPDYAGIIEGMRFGKVQVAWYGNKSAMEAVDRAGAEIFAQQTKLDGTLGYYSHVIVPADSKLKSLDDLLKCDKSLNFGIGDPNSTSGFLVPTYYVFAQKNIDPRQCFKTVRNAGHETNMMAVANKQVDAATNNSEQLAGKSAGPVRDKVRVIWTSPLIPSDPITYRKDLSKELKDKIKGFFLTYGRLGPDVAHAKTVLAGMADGQGPFTDSNNTQLYPIRQLELYKNKLKLSNDEKMSAAEKASKIAEIDAQLKTLEVLMANLGK